MTEILPHGGQCRVHCLAP